MLEPWFLWPLLGAVGLGAVAGPVGCFVLWRRLAYFGDAIAHAALLGVTLGIFFHLPSLLGVLAMAGGMAALLATFSRTHDLPRDTQIGILAHGTLSAGIIAAAGTGGASSLLARLMGDVLALGWEETLTIWLAGGAMLALLCVYWRPLISMTLHEEVASAEGVPVRRLGWLVTFLVALAVALAVSTTGVLLVTALLIVPAATARCFARSPSAMAWYAAIIGIVATLLGFTGSYYAGAPSGPSIVIAAVSLFGISRFCCCKKQK